jgi:hypothetical protein
MEKNLEKQSSDLMKETNFNQLKTLNYYALPIN